MRSKDENTAVADPSVLPKTGDTAAVVDLLPGVRLAGRFLINKRLGSGATGTVFSALDTTVGQKVAVKLLRPDLSEEISRERLRREVRAARPGHNNVVTVFDLHEDSGRVFLSMELVEGRSLRDELGRRDQLPWHEVVGIGRQVAAGLAHLHNKGLVHRDVKPGNILIANDGTAKVCDMGLARPVRQGGTVTETAMVVGTPAYMAPEQARAGDLTPASDVYALGLTLFRSLTGHVPFEGDTAVETLMLRQKARPPGARGSRTPCPRWFDRLLRRMLEPNASDRPSATVVAAALEKGAFAWLPSKTTLRRTASALAVIVVAVVVVLGIWSRWITPQLDPTTNLRFTAQQFVDETAVEITDTDGNVLQTVDLGGTWDPDQFRSRAARRVAFGDFNGDGWVDAAVARFRDESGRPLVIFLRQPDGSLEFAVEHRVNLSFSYDGEVFTNFRVIDMISEDLDRDGRAEIALIEASSPYYPAVLRVINWNNQTRFRLWHPGVLKSVQAADRDHDGRQELYLGGTCNFLTPPESNTSAPVFLAIEADWNQPDLEVDLFEPGRKFASSTPSGIRIHYAAWPRIDVPAFRAAWQAVLVQKQSKNVETYLFSLIVSLQDRVAPTPGTGFRMGVRHAFIGFDLQQINAQWEPTVAEILGVDPNIPEMQALLKPRYWNGQTWQEESCFMATSDSVPVPGS